MTDSRLILWSKAIEGDDVRVRRMDGTEALSSPFSFRLELLLKAEAPWTHDVITDMQSRGALLMLEPADDSDGEPPTWGGLLRSIDYVARDDPGHFLYRAELVSHSFPLTLFRRSRVFQDLSVTEILKNVLGDGTFAKLKYATSSLYASREYTVQFEESDFDFVSRLLEHEGLFYFDRSLSQMLVVGDDNAAFDQVEGHEFIRWVPRLDGLGITNLSWERRIVPEHAVVRDYDWRNPSSLVQGDSPVHEHGMGIQVFFGENIKNVEAAHIAKVRGQELTAPHDVIRATSNIPWLRPGHRFTLEAPASLGPEVDGAELVVFSVRHHMVQGTGESGSASEPYRNELVLFPFATPFRPARKTPKPRIDGLVYAIIDGETASTAAPVDDQGRYRVYFPFDTNAKAGGRASRWVRMAQPYAGAGYGMHFPLHIGTQVIVAHINGDPDRPVIVGAIPNAATTSPVASANATQSAIRSHNGILFELEDDA